MRKVEVDGRVMYEVFGQLMTPEEFERAFPAGESEPGSNLIGWHQPIVSNALGVHKSQVQEARQMAKQRGVPTEFVEDQHGARPVFTSSRHFREYAKKHGFRHRGY